MATKSGSRYFLYLSIAAVNLLSLTTGLMLAWSSPVLPKLESSENNPLPEIITSDDKSWIGSLLALGAAFSPFPFAFASDKFGRKMTLILVAIPYAVACLLATFSKHVILFYFIRLIAGFGVGGVFTVIPTYIAEVSEDSIRGMLGSTINNFLSVGLVISYAIGPYISIMWFSIVCVIAPAIYIVVFTIFMYDTPYSLMRKGHTNKAEEALCQLRSKNSADVKKEMEELASAVKVDNGSSGSFMDIFKSKGTTKALVIAVMLGIFQQLSGINIVLFYGQTIFEESEIEISAEIPPMIIGGVQLIASFVTPIAVDRLGRKILLVFSAVGMLVAEVPLGVYFYLKDNGTDVEDISWLPIVTLVLYMITYNCGFGPLPWTVMAEIFPGNIKSVATSLTASSCWFVSFIVTKFFSSVSDEIGMGGSFWIFAGFNFIAAAFTFIYVPETKGKSFQEIQDILNA